MLDPAIRILSLEYHCIDPTLESLVIKIGHPAVGIAGLQNHLAIDALDLLDVFPWKDMTLKVNHHRRSSFPIWALLLDL